MKLEVLIVYPSESLDVWMNAFLIRPTSKFSSNNKLDLNIFLAEFHLMGFGSLALITQDI